jgi:hypothetical protein
MQLRGQLRTFCSESNPEQFWFMGDSSSNISAKGPLQAEAAGGLVGYTAAKARGLVHQTEKLYFLFETKNQTYNIEKNGFNLLNE